MKTISKEQLIELIVENLDGPYIIIAVSEKLLGDTEVVTGKSVIGALKSVNPRELVAVAEQVLENTKVVYDGSIFTIHTLID